MSDCLFCKIIAGEIPSARIFEDEAAIVIKDITPQAPVHLLAIAKKHITAAAQCANEGGLIGHVFEIIALCHSEWGLTDGFRVVTNSGSIAGQSVEHLHFHILGGGVLSVNFG